MGDFLRLRYGRKVTAQHRLVTLRLVTRIGHIAMGPGMFKQSVKGALPIEAERAEKGTCLAFAPF
jgi:hypothetical protein